MRHHEMIVQRRTPPHERAFERLLPEYADQGSNEQHLQQAHPHMRRHFKSPQFEQSKLQPAAVWSKELVHTKLSAVRVPCNIREQVAEQTIHNRRRNIS